MAPVPATKRISTSSVPIKKRGNLILPALTTSIKLRDSHLICLLLFLTSDLVIVSKSRTASTNNLNLSLFRSRSMPSEPTFPSFIPRRFSKGWFSLATESSSARSRNLMRRAIRSSENPANRRSRQQNTDSAYDSVVYDQVKPALTESQAEEEE